MGRFLFVELGLTDLRNRAFQVKHFSIWELGSSLSDALVSLLRALQ